MAHCEDLTPMMRQYQRAKAEHRDAILLFRMGDFYEMFYDDARLAARLLGLALTSREKGERAVPMAGVPHHSVNAYVKRLVEAGYKVAICEQVEDPRQARGLVEREVVRIITPGTLTEDVLLGGADHNYLAALCAAAAEHGPVGLAWMDLSTGTFCATDVTRARLMDELSRIAPAECLVSEDDDAEALVEVARQSGAAMVTRRPAWAFGAETARRTLLEHFQVATLEGFGCQHLGPALGAAGAILQYLQETQKIPLKHINRLAPVGERERVILDRSSQASLELVRTLREGRREGTLLWVLDRTRTPMGARLLRERLLSPLTRAEEIKARLDGVEAFTRDHALREAVRRTLERVYDIERLATRVSTGRANARDLVALKDSLSAIPSLRERLEQAGGSAGAILAELAARLDPVEEARILIGTAVAPDPPATLHEGGLIRDGYDAELDELRSIQRTGRDWIARFQAQEAERTGIQSLKVGYNQVFGYYIEVTHTHSARVPPEYIRKQTLKNAERYITPQLKEYETKVLTAEERAKEIEYRLFGQVREKIAAFTERLQRLAAAIAELDVFTALADVAVEYRYVRPEVTEDIIIDIEDGRHPVLERTLAEEFVPNDVHLDAETRILLVTGPNMAGKSTYIRQVALIVLMAQMGSFVPAKRARIGVVDRIFTRVGAADELARGQSTFMVEMVETANILHNASERSLIVLDEVGRGTSTYDGVSIAWAVAEYLHERVGARTVFATHYHELTELATLYPRIKNLNVAVREWGNKVIFLHKIVEGATDKSYGLHVAALAGIPGPVIERARTILANLEAQARELEEMPKLAGAAGDAHPPASVSPRARKPRRRDVQLILFAPESDVLRRELRTLELEKMTPIEALAKLEELKRRAEST